MQRLPERIESERLILRLWRAEDAPALNDAVARSVEHLRPWMPWVAEAPDTVAERVARIAEWNATWEAGGDAVYGILTREGTIAGGTGLHHRSADPGVLDIGYWVAAHSIGRGYATEAAAALRDAAFAIPGVVAVDLHHDKANAASARVPQKLGFTLLAEGADEITSPGEAGIDCHWRLDRPEDVTLRTATTADRAAILALVREAFCANGSDGHEEVDIVERTWAREGAVPDGLEIVAVVGDVIVGHVLCARADAGGREVVAVAPLAVAPAHHSAGVGSALIREVIRRASSASAWPLIALLGSTVYYGRFGFESSGPLGITYPPIGVDDPHVQVLRLAGYDASVRGDLVYCWER